MRGRSLPTPRSPQRLHPKYYLKTIYIVLKINIYRDVNHLFFINCGAFDINDKMNPHCPNYASCKLINTEAVIRDEIKRQAYIEAYCKAGEGNWKKCKRLITKEYLHFCPDFVLPDNPMCVDEIFEQFDEEI